MSWEPWKLNELGEVSRGRSRHRPRDAAHLYGGSYPFIQTGDVKHASLYLTEHSQTYSEAGLEQSKLWPAGTLCITIAANIADTAILSYEACFPDSIIGFIPDPKKADARFIKYYFDAALQGKYKQFSQGAAQDNLSQEKLLSLDLVIPDVDEQKKIADKIAIFDSLIENNRRRISILEQSARLLYREWFVYLRFPGHEHVKVGGGVPEGWEERPVGEISDEVRVSVKPEHVNPGTPYIGLEHIPRRSITLNDWGKSDDITSQKFAYEEGDILFGKIRPYFHKVGFTLTNGIASSDAIILRPTEKRLYYYLLLLVSSDQFVGLASQTVKEGSKMPRADWKYLKRQFFPIPPQNLLLELNSICEPIVKQLKSLSLQTIKLREARDLLLPRLMSGEIQV